MDKRRRRLSFVLALGLLLAGLLLVVEVWGNGLSVARAADPTRYVDVNGTDDSDCTVSSNPCRTVQHAVDQAASGDEIRVATGVYTGVLGRPSPPGYGNPAVVTQVVYISKTVTLRGGYSTSDWTTSYPATQPTTLDAQQKGRVLFIEDAIAPTVENLGLTDGKATGLGGGTSGQDAGGGVYIITATASLNRNTVSGGSAAWGGGVFLKNSDATLSGNTVYSNTAAPYGGGGVHLWSSPATLRENSVFSNTAVTYGGGVYVQSSNNATLDGNTVSHNTTNNWGGGVALNGSAATLSHNTVSTNNSANWGGGIYLTSSPATLKGNTVSNNTANNGAGFFLGSGPATLINTLIADNKVMTTTGSGSASYVYALSRLSHTTVARNAGGTGRGFHVTNNSTVALTDTIVVSHTVGIYVSSGSTVNLESTLWNGNGSDWAGPGTVSHNHDYAGDPAFVDPDAWDYHLRANSPAIDRGVNAGVTVDLDGVHRPMLLGYDLGAYEFPSTLLVSKLADPDPVSDGATLTYTIHVTNTGPADVEAVVTDTLPATITPAGILTWTPTITTPDGVWTEQFTVTVDLGHGGTLTNAVEVETQNGMAGYRQVTSQIRARPELALAKEVEPDPVSAGATLTYTIHVTNTGNVGLTTYITDSLPDEVDPTGDLFWMTTITAPGGVWTKQVAVTAEPTHIGTLTNVVRVTTHEGASGLYTVTSEVAATPALDIGKTADPSPVSAGDWLTYTLRLTNTGNVALTAYVTDTLPDGLTTSGDLVWTPVITTPGDVSTGQFVVTVRPDFLGTLTNVVRVSTDEGPAGIYTLTTPVEATPRLDLSKAVEPDPVASGDALTYTITLTNTGNVTLNATLVDTLPGQVSPSGHLTWTPTVATPGGVWTEQFTVTASPRYIGTLTNAVSVTTLEGASGLYSIASAVQGTPAPALTISKSGFPAHAQPGKGLTYTLRITNTGNIALTAFVTDTLPTDVAPTGQMTWQPTLPAPDGVWTQWVTVTVNPGYLGTLTNVVQVSTAEGATGSFELNTPVDSTPELDVRKRVDPNPVAAGSTLTYTIFLTNTGNVPLHATVTDTLPAGVTTPGDLTWTATLTSPGDVWMQDFFVTASPTYYGTLTNVVWTTTEDGVTAAYTLLSQVGAKPGLTASKSAFPAHVKVGKVLTYTLRITNTGNIALTAYVTDVLPSGVTPTGQMTWQPTIPSPNGVWTHTFTVTVNSDASGTLLNQMLVSTLEGATGLATDTVTVELEQLGIYLPIIRKR